jgi:DNA polymerase-4
MAGEIYRDYTSQIEPFGLDESWLDVTGSLISGDGGVIADSIRERVKSELGSDMKKPDATVVIGSEDFREKVWPLPVQELLYVGNATYRKLKGYGIHTLAVCQRTGYLRG